MSEQDGANVEMNNEEAQAEQAQEATQETVDEASVDVTKLTKELKDLTGDLEHAQKQIADFRELAQRTRADADNMRKRMEKERVQHIRGANKKLLINFLEFMDDFERALQIEVGEGGKEFYDGVKMLYAKLMTFLKNEGVHEYAETGDEFDPNIHEAFSMDSSDEYDKETVIEVYQKGYMMEDLVIRTAKVRVGKPASAEMPASEAADEDAGDSVDDAQEDDA